MGFRQLEKHIEQINNLFKTLKLRISYDKSTMVIFTKNNILLNLRHNRLTNIEISSNVKYLGVLFTHNLNWNLTIELIQKKDEKFYNLVKARATTKLGGSPFIVI